jgi:alkanesulfonate monooxygenase SsuD/methylene tetrahydromethanopterin reductase-like flavin-dependent oxidoreductase (luciferase family)
MWEPGKATYTGKVHSVHDAVSYPRPVHPIPIYVGGKRPHTAALAARLADGLNVTGLASVEDVLPAIKKRLEDPSSFQFSILDTPLLGADRAAVAESVERWRGRLRAEVFADRHHAGMPDGHVSRYREVVDKGINAVFVSPVGLSAPAEVQAWEPVIEALSSP